MVAWGGVHGCPRGGMCGCLGGWAWLLPGVGACMVAPGGGGMVAPGRGVCMVALGVCAWLLRGGMHGCSWGVCMAASGGGACVVAPGGGVRGIRRDTEIRSMSGRYASYWNAFLLLCNF